MPATESQAGSFGRTSPVWSYWLTRCEGFAVESKSGRTLGTVEATGFDPGTGRTVIVVRRGGAFGRHRLLLPTERVALVMPWRETLVLGRRAERRIGPPIHARVVSPVRASTVAAATGLFAVAAAGATRTRAAAIPLGRRAYRSASRFLALAWPVLVSAASAAARAAGGSGLRLLRVAGLTLGALVLVCAAVLVLLGAWLWHLTPVAGRWVWAGIVGLVGRARRSGPPAARAGRRLALWIGSLPDAGPRIRAFPRLSGRR